MKIFNTINFIISHPLGSKNKIRSILRFIIWQIRSRLSSDYQAISWVCASKLLVKRGDAGLTGNIYVGLHEFQDMGFLLHFLRSNDVFMDVGANAGSFTVLASNVVGSKTIAIEPIPDTFKRLEFNIATNNIGEKVKALNMGLGHAQGVLKFTSNLDCMNHVVHDSIKKNDNFNFVSVNVDTLDSIAYKQEISMIKIDVEGYELPVLYGAKKILNSSSLKAVIMEINSSTSLYGHQYNEALMMMKKYSFICCKYCPFDRTLISINNSDDLNGNVIFVKDLQFVQNRLLESIKFNVNGIIF
jgi:FkbM family methyltransferase